MKKLKKVGIVSLSTVLSLGILAPGAGAANFESIPQQDRIQIQIANTETVVMKKDLINKLKELFPGKFDFLSENDFHMMSGHRFPDDEITWYDLSFHKEIGGKYIHGSVGFAGEDLEIQHFYYDPIITSDALFPPQVTKKEAEKVATAFLKKLSKNGKYQLDSVNNFYPGNQTLVEPIRYGFSFVRTVNDVPVSDQSVHISVLGNGEIVEFHRPMEVFGAPTYDDASKVLAEEEVLEKMKANLAVDLQYQVDYDMHTGEPYVKLVYQPVNGGLGVHAISGEWQTASGFSAELPSKKEVQLLADEPLDPRSTDFSLEEAKKVANELLAIDSDKVKLVIESVQEYTNYNGKEVISIHYMYEYANGGYGASLEFDKQTGDIIQYHNVKQDVLRQMGELEDQDKKLSSEEVVEQAKSYLKEYAPTYLHDYAEPVNEAVYEEWSGGFHLGFPRVVDGVIVSGDEIFVQIAADGSLLSLNVHQQNIDNWPQKEEILSNEEALAAFKEKLTLDLRYAKTIGNEDNYYHLVFSPLFNGNLYSYMEATTGEWNKPNVNPNVTQEIEHPWAANELNYLISSGILKVDDVAAFDPNATVTKGEAIEIIMKSLTPFYRIFYPEQETLGQSFDNIDRDHPLYQVIERAVDMGILKTDESTFNVDESLTREELAVWYIRAMDLEQVAKHSSIYQLKLADADKIQADYVGHVALVDSFGILTANNGRFNPDQEVTFAQVGVSIFRLAKQVYESNSQRYYY